MNALRYFAKTVIPAAMQLLPEKMNSPQARAMMLAIGLQESAFQHRRQVGGPARGFYQFEAGGGVRGVLSHHATSEHVRKVLAELQYDTLIDTSYNAIEHNDILATVYARLLLWTHPQPVPAVNESERAWKYYLSLWRPGKPHPDKWAANFSAAWEELRAL